MSVTASFDLPGPPATATLLVSCRDRTGLVAALSRFVFENDGNILDADQHADLETGLFFMRLVWNLDGFKLGRAEMHAALADMAARFDLTWELTYSDIRPRVAVLASKAPHCLYDLLLSWQLGELGGELVSVISNHDGLRPVAGHFGVPFEHVPVDPKNKAAAEAAQQRLFDELRVDLIVLARYMQILSPAFVARWPGRIINIHHSFLPAFVGAKPYHQARARGVKVIGATAHYVTADLDQGPIIEQDVTRVSHRDDVEALEQKGRELERQVLTRAVRAHLQRRVLVTGNKTIVFG
ncbi:MAG TPA: formyltetrahydrofolate deformylase [Polyangia bacterium]|jgi:formyltetrahydrofolate deformylase|nr:formyltetrahydrofolate deformylase [Polyangia bacterium]